MNAAAKMIHQTNFFSGQLTDIRLTKHFCLQMILLLCVLFSAVAVIYTTNQYRMACVKLQQAEQKNHQLHLHGGQLLLEHASLSTPGKVQRLATSKLGMVLPDKAHIMLLRVK